eukprot:12177165-Karenia_brevis.AAC.1
MLWAKYPIAREHSAMHDDRLYLASPAAFDQLVRDLNSDLIQHRISEQESHVRVELGGCTITWSGQKMHRSD